MSDTNNTGPQRLSAEEVYQKQVNEITQKFLMAGGRLEFVLGSFKILEIFYTGPAQHNSLSQAARMSDVRNQSDQDAQNPRQ